MTEEERQRLNGLSIDQLAAYMRNPAPAGDSIYTPEERQMYTAQAEEFAALEHRADMDPWLKDNPIRRLGYRQNGGLRSVNFLPEGPDEAAYYGDGYGSEHLRGEMIRSITDSSGDTGLPVFDSMEVMDPERYAAFSTMVDPLLMDEGTIAVGENYNSYPVLAHEFGHAGSDIVRDMVDNDPAALQQVLDAGLTPLSEYTPAELHSFDEAFTELSDDPRDSWNTPGGFAAMGPTIQYIPEPGSPALQTAETYLEVYQRLAAEELTRQGEPPRNPAGLATLP